MAINITNKREQIYEVILRIITTLILIANNDIKLPLRSLPYILILFKDLKVSTISTY
jgi:hypothetical protein